ncbi:MAG: 50S ribosomal protein L18 [Candidatus Sericytochromatia bacterium]|nr:50S ribosomal protein L18 [Candidatus Sericytochromatia bacterium]
MITKKSRKIQTSVRHLRIRKKLSGSSERPRLAVYRSNQHVYAQVIDDVAGRTLVSASSLELKLERGGTVEAARQVGQTVAERAKAAGIEAVVYDRGGNLYHGRVAALADAAREAGLNF